MGKWHVFQHFFRGACQAYHVMMGTLETIQNYACLSFNMQKKPSKMISGKTKKRSKSLTTGLKMIFQIGNVLRSNSMKNAIPFAICNSKHEGLFSRIGIISVHDLLNFYTSVHTHICQYSSHPQTWICSYFVIMPFKPPQNSLSLKNCSCSFAKSCT